MKKVLMTLALALSLSAPAFAATTISAWDTTRNSADYVGTQADTAAAGNSANGVVFSRHNMSSYGEHYQMTTSITGTATKQLINPLSVISTEVCVFCHTPHFGKTDSAPLWNRGSSATGYVAYGTTLGGTSITSVSGSSLACLSCHDGVTTFDNLINKPGKGSATNATGSDLGWMMSEIGAADTIGDTTATGQSSSGTKDTGSRLNIGGTAGTGARTASAVDLSNDHPINVTYNASVASLRPTSTVISSIVMDQARSNYGDDNNNHGMGAPAADTGTYGRSDNLWAVRGFISNTATIENVLRDSGKVACASCHDPHYKNQTNNDPSIVCGWLPSLSNYNKESGLYAGIVSDAFYGGPYLNELDTPSAEGCLEAATGVDRGAISVTGIDAAEAAANYAPYGGPANPNSINVAPAVDLAGLGNAVARYDHYVGAKDSDGLFLRRVGGNSNSGVCRTCHNK